MSTKIVQKLNTGIPPVLRVRELGVSFEIYSGRFERRLSHGVRGLNLELHPGEILGIAGSSGSGKSLLAHAIMGILPYNAVQTGSIEITTDQFGGSNPAGMHSAASPRRRVPRRHKDPWTCANQEEIALVPQSITYLNPLKRVRKQLVEGRKLSAEELGWIATEFELTRSDLDKYPFQLSGGMARRVLLATAMLSPAKIVIADEPTPGVPVALAKKLLADLRTMADNGRAIIVISHDIEMIAEIADRMAILDRGKLVTTLSAEEFSHPERGNNHPYAVQLWQALPQNQFLDAITIGNIKTEEEERHS